MMRKVCSFLGFSKRITWILLFLCVYAFIWRIRREQENKRIPTENSDIIKGHPSLKNSSIDEHLQYKQGVKNSSIDAASPMIYVPLLLLWTQRFHWRYGLDSHWFKVGFKAGENSTDVKCGTRTCRVTTWRQQLNSANVVVFHSGDINGTDLPVVRHQWQHWLFFTHESVINSQPITNIKDLDGLFNWTSTYETSSDFPRPHSAGAVLAAKYHRHKKIVISEPDMQNKTGVVVFFESHCVTDRQNFINQLSNHSIRIDKYGRCHQPDPCRKNITCISAFRNKYKFSIAAENSGCRNYITEKFFDALSKYNNVPIVMGAPLEDYLKVAPPDSFLHVQNFSSIKALADHLHYLDKNNEAYLRYHKWRETYMISTARRSWFCTICDKLHEEHKHKMTEYKTYHNLSSIWSVRDKCTYPAKDIIKYRK